MVYGKVGVCEGGGGDGTFRWKAVAVVVRQIWCCNVEIRLVDRVAYPLSSKTCPIDRVYPLIQSAALLSY